MKHRLLLIFKYLVYTLLIKITRIFFTILFYVPKRPKTFGLLQRVNFVYFSKYFAYNQHYKNTKTECYINLVLEFL